MTDAVCNGLRAKGIAVATADSEGMRGRSDVDQLAHASRLGSVIYTFNSRDFQRIHTTTMTSGQSHAGIVLTKKSRYDIGEQIRRLERLCLARTPEEMVNTLEFLQRRGGDTD